jgi:type II secretory pathway pseudopilin PulG
MLLLRLDDELRQEPLLIENLVSIAIAAITLQPIYEGLAKHRWSAAQITELERALAAKDFLADFQFAMRGERNFAVEMEENERISGEYKVVEFDDNKPTVETIDLHRTPSAFFYQSELAFAQLNEKFLQPLVDTTNRLVAPAALRKADAALEKQRKHAYFSPYKILALMTYPAVSASVNKFAFIQSAVDLARLACALERYRLAHGEYPATLDVLAPQFIEKLPHDLINGQPLHYRRTDGPSSQSSDAAGGKFILYSVGWNETDDGGTVVLTKTGSVDRDKGDWVWQYPAN